MVIRYYFSDYFVSKFYKFLLLHFSNGESYVAVILKSNGSIIRFIRRSNFASLYNSGCFNICPLVV